MSLRDLESESIRAWVQKAADQGCFTGRCLDFGSGREPYRGIVEAAGAEYVPFDRRDFPGSVATTNVGNDYPLSQRWDAILSNQVLQYVPSGYVIGVLVDMFSALMPGGCLVLTLPTNWPIVEKEDLRRFTVAGAVELLALAGFSVVECEYREYVTFEGERWPIGLGAIARKGDA